MSTIDNSTKVNIGILGVLLGATMGGAVYFSTLRGEVTEIRKAIEKMESTMDRIAIQSQTDGRDLSSVKARQDAQRVLIDNLAERVRILEQKK